MRRSINGRAASIQCKKHNEHLANSSITPVNSRLSATWHNHCINVFN